MLVFYSEHFWVFLLNDYEEKQKSEKCHPILRFTLTHSGRPRYVLRTLRFFELTLYEQVKGGAVKQEVINK